MLGGLPVGAVGLRGDSWLALARPGVPLAVVPPASGLYALAPQARPDPLESTSTSKNRECERRHGILVSVAVPVITDSGTHTHKQMHCDTSSTSASLRLSLGHSWHPLIYL